MLRVVEGGCRFSEIDAVLRKARFFPSRYPIQISPVLHAGKIWDNVNIILQYNVMGKQAIWLGIHHHAQIQTRRIWRFNDPLANGAERDQRHRR